MPRRTKRARSLSAKRGWATRRRRAAAEFRRRSKASKKGWRRRHARERIEKQAKAPAKGKGRLGEHLVTWSYHPTKGKVRIVDFVVIARSTEDAELFVVKAAAQGEDTEGADLTWLASIPWDEVSSTRMPDDEENLSRKEIKALGEGYVAIR
jgi:hypothetical protein